MPNYAGTVTNLVQGDFRQIPWQITNVPTDGGVTKAWFTVKVDATALDAAAIFQKVITEVLDTGEGHITNTGLVGNVATGFFNLISADTELLEPDVPYVYDLQVLISMNDLTSRIETPEIGVIQVRDGVTDAIS